MAALRSYPAAREAVKVARGGHARVSPPAALREHGDRSLDGGGGPSPDAPPPPAIREKTRGGKAGDFTGPRSPRTLPPGRRHAHTPDRPHIACCLRVLRLPARPGLGRARKHHDLGRSRDARLALARPRGNGSPRHAVPRPVCPARCDNET